MKNSRCLKGGFRLWIKIAAMVTLAFTTGCRGQNVYTVGEGVTLWEVPPYPEFFQNWAAALELYVNDSLSIVISVVFIFVVLELVGLFFYCRYKRQTAHNRYHDRFVVYSRSYETKAEKAKSSSNKNLLDNLYREHCGKQANTFLFTLKELELATRNFSRENELGSGAFGTVYKGNLRDGRVVAVKRANTHKADVEQFENEVSILSKVNHRNLVKLLGCCLDLKLPLLVYEFIPNGTLQEHFEPSPTRLLHQAQLAPSLQHRCANSRGA